MVLCSQRTVGLAPGPPWYEALTPSQMCSTAFSRITGRLTTDGMKMPQALLVGVRWLRLTLFTMPCDMFF